VNDQDAWIERNAALAAAQRELAGLEAGWPLLEEAEHGP
jgi:hypothetical protein